MIRDDLSPEQLAAVAAEGQRLADADAARRSAEQPAQEPAVVANVQREVHEPVKARNITLIAVHQLEIQGRIFHHGSEIMPGLIPAATLAKLIDQGRVREYDSRDRHSLYRLFSKFSGCKESEPLTEEEIEAYSL
jgi:hypothetical protein